MQRIGFDLIAQAWAASCVTGSRMDPRPRSVCRLRSRHWHVGDAGHPGRAQAPAHHRAAGAMFAVETAIGYSSWTAPDGLPTPGSRLAKLAPPPERAYQRIQTHGRLSDDRRGRAVDLAALRLGDGAPGMGRRSALRQWSTADEEPPGAQAEMEAVFTTNDRPLGDDARGRRGAMRAVYNYAQMFDDPQIQHRGLVSLRTTRNSAIFRIFRTPIRIDDGSGTHGRAETR